MSTTPKPEPTIESVQTENAQLKEQLASAHREIQRLQALALSYEVTGRTMAAWVAPASMAPMPGR